MSSMTRKLAANILLCSVEVILFSSFVSHTSLIKPELHGKVFLGFAEAVVHIIMNLLLVAASTWARFRHHVDCGSTFITEVGKKKPLIHCVNTQKSPLFQLCTEDMKVLSTYVCDYTLKTFLYINLQQIHGSYCKTSFITEEGCWSTELRKSFTFYCVRRRPHMEPDYRRRLRSGRASNRGRIDSRGESFSLLPCLTTGSWVHLASYRTDVWGFFLQDKASDVWSCPVVSSTSSVYDKNERSYTSTPLYAFFACMRTATPFH